MTGNRHAPGARVAAARPEGIWQEPYNLNKMTVNNRRPEDSAETKGSLCAVSPTDSQLGERLSAAAWKETLSALTMGLAHELNNVLAGTLAPAELMLAQTGAQDPNRKTLEMIKQQILRASDVVKRMVDLHRSKAGVRGYLDLNQVVSELAELVGKILPRRIRIQTELAPGQLPVYLDAVELRQAVLSLALNAAEAMRDGGQLVFRVTAHTTGQELRLHRGTFPRLPCVCLSIKDTGAGIPAGHMAQLFDPVFTASPPGEATSRSLYNASRFAQAHGGAISVESGEGTGTTIGLWLPQADFTEAERETDDAPPASGD